MQDEAFDARAADDAATITQERRAGTVAGTGRSVFCVPGPLS